MGKSASLREDETTESERVGHLEVGDDQFIIYDRQKAPAWVQSDMTVRVEQ